MLEKLLLNQLLSYIPYDVLWQFESVNRRNAHKEFINDVTFKVNGIVLTIDDKLELCNTSDYYLDSYLKEKHKCYRKGRMMIVNNCYNPVYSIGLGRVKFSKKFFNNDIGEKVKPILRPLSDLNKLLTIDGADFIPRIWFKDNYYCDVFEYEGKLHIERKTFELHLIYQQLLKWHFDVYSLIDQGLAYNMNDI